MEITIPYKCACMQDEGTFQMLERGDNEDIRDFMDRVTLHVSIDHRERSPLCMSPKMEYVKIQADGNSGIGKAPRLH